MEKILEEIKQELKKYDRQYDLCVTTSTKKKAIRLDIYWGDWKHDHAACKKIISDIFFKNKLYPEFTTIITEQDGSDCYSATHCVEVI